MKSNVGCQAGADNAFGPQVTGCRESFDFTMLFEQSIFSMLPSLLLLILALAKSLSISKTRTKIQRQSRDVLKWAKLSTIACLGVTQVVVIALYAQSSSNPNHVSIAASICALVGTLAMPSLSYLEHHRSERPSLILTTYLLSSILLDICQTRTLWLRHIDSPLAAIFTCSVAIKTAILLFESLEKRHLLRDPYRQYSPEALGGIINRSVFWWLNPLLLQGWSKKMLRQEDLPSLDPQLSTSSFGNRLQQSWSMSDQNAEYALLKVTLMTFWKPLLLVFFPRICLIGFTISQPLLINRTVSLLSQPNSRERTNVGRSLIGAAALIYLGIAVSTVFFQHQIYRCTTMIRGGLVTLVYDATLGLHYTDAVNTAAITHMSTDIDRIAAGMARFDVLWAAPIEVGLAIYLLWRQIGLACIAPVGIALGCVLIAFGLGKMSRKAQTTWMAALQNRIKATSSMLSEMKAIRMSGLSGILSATVHNLRVEELELSKSYRRLNVAMNTIGTLLQALAPVTAFLFYALFLQTDDSRLNPSTAFTALSLISLLSSPIFLFMHTLPAFTASMGCYDRIQKYLSSANKMIDSSSSGDIKRPSSIPSDRKSDLETDVVLLKAWASNLPNISEDLVSLHHASFSFQGQSSAILKDISLTLKSGSLTTVTGSVGSGKSALLLAILGELRLKSGTLHKSNFLSVGICEQTPWLPNNSARHIILGSMKLDIEWYNNVLSACVLDKDLANLSQGDQTVIGSRGISLSGGQKQRLSLARALYAKKRLLLLDDVTSGLDASTAQILVQRVFGPEGLCRRHSIAVLLVTHDVQLMHITDTIITLGSEGKIISIVPASKDDSDDGISLQVSKSTNEGFQTEIAANKAPDPRLVDLTRKVGEMRLYLYYSKAMGWFPMSSFLILFAGFIFCVSFPNIWLKWWSEAGIDHPGDHLTMYLVVYAVLGASATILMFASVWVLLVEIVPRSSIKLHKTLLDTVLSAPFSFFSSTDTGVTLNRFSQDMSLIDMQLPFAFLQLVDGVFECLAAAILIAVSSKWSTLIYPVLLVVLYFVQKFYLTTSRQMRFLDLEAKAPLYSHFLETLQGLVTIRAFEWNTSFQDTNQRLLNESQKPYYLMYCIQRWLNLIMDLMVTIIAVTIVALAMEIPSLASGGALGVALVNITSFSRSLTTLVQAWTQMETSMGAISRLSHFVAETSSENLLLENHIPGAEWPSKGAMEFRNMMVSYDLKSENVLHDITLKIVAGSKVAICGRTGSGKSSLISSIFGINNIRSGSITIDGIDIASIPREIVRQRLTVLPQDPLILSGSTRCNIDPMSIHTEEEILSALNEVGLSDLVFSRGGLDAPLQASTISKGQQQLLCLARALISRPRILILDEATSNVDIDSEVRMLKLVHEKTQSCTVLAVAHQLRTIIDFDAIVILENGKVLEFGKPRDLLDRESKFKELWELQN